MQCNEYRDILTKPDRKAICTQSGITQFRCIDSSYNCNRQLRDRT